MTDRPPLPPEVLERLRTIGLRIDAAGRLWHQGDEVVHAGLRRPSCAGSTSAPTAG